MHPAEQRVHDDVRTYGWHITTVADADPEFAYTIGLFRTFGHPEFLIVGLPSADVAPTILNALGDEVRAGRRRFAAGDTSDAALEGADVTFRPLPRWVRTQHLGFAVWFYGAANPFPALQVVYPDGAGHWPWAPAATDAFRAAQPVFDAPGSTRWSRFRSYVQLLAGRRFGLPNPSAS